MKFYKITNENENHHGMKYKDGLNIDVMPFRPFGNCEPGGIYYASEDILAFCGYGPWIREVAIPEDAQVYENPGNPKKWKADRVFLGPRKKLWTLKTFQNLVEQGADIHAENDLAVGYAALKGHLDIVKFLVEQGADIHVYDDEALRFATENGHLDIVKYLGGFGGGKK